MKKADRVILGAGPTGLGAAWRLEELKQDSYILIEKEDVAGGLSRSFVDPEGFTWDIGGHVQFSHYPYFDQVMNSVLPDSERLYHEREAWAFFQNQFIPYPFQNNIHLLPKSLGQECLEDLKSVAKEKSTPSNFREWLSSKFGEKLCEIFMHPYNFKVWAYQPEKMNYQWIGERVSVVDISRIENNFKSGQPDKNWGPNNRFWFPKIGGTGQIWKNVANKIPQSKYLFNNSIKKISPQQKEILLSNGERIIYKQLISTIPLDILWNCLDEKPKTNQEPKDLLYSSTNVVGFGIEGRLPDKLNKKCWIYFSENQFPFYRATVFSNYSPNNVPDIKKHYSIMLEVSESKDKAVDHKTIIDQCLNSLIKAELISSKDKILSKFHFKTNYGYPTPSVERDKILREIVPALEELSIFSRGRFGGWKYEVSNQDHSFMQGVEIASKLSSGDNEVTFRI